MARKSVNDHRLNAFLDPKVSTGPCVLHKTRVYFSTLRMHDRLTTLLRTTFLGRVWAKDRRLGGFFIGFVVLQSVAQLATADVTPFFLYGMYSDVLHPQPTYVRVACHVDGEPLVQEDMPRYAGELFFSTIYRLDQLDANGNEDIFKPFLDKRFGWLSETTRIDLAGRLSFRPEQRPALESWVDRYLEKALGRSIDTVRIDREIYRYEGQRPVLLEHANLISVPR